MSEQLLLFERKKPAWIDRIWQTIDPRKQDETVAVLAQMARDALTGCAVKREEERGNEP